MPHLLKATPSSSIVNLLNLPDSVILRICSFLARRPLFTAPDRPFSELPYDLLNFAAVCHRARTHAATLCDSLNFESYTSWRALVSWLNFANSSLRTVRICAMPTNVELPFRQLQLLPPAVVLSTLSYHSFPLRCLDLSGLNLYTPHDAMLLAMLLAKLRTTLTHLTLLDSGSCLSHVVSAVTNARLTNLVSLTYLSLRADCRKALTDIVSSFILPPPSSANHSKQSLITPTSSLSNLYLHLQESAQCGTCFTDENFLSHLCPSLTTFTLASEFESPKLVPYTFMASFSSLQSITLKDMVLDHQAVLYMLANLPDLRQLHLDGCLILHDDETCLHAISAPFTRLVATSAVVLRSLWLPARCFSVPELRYLQSMRLNLESIALTIAQSALQEMPGFCQTFSPTLRSLRLAIFSDETSPVDLSTEDQVHLVEALQNAKFLRRLHLVSVYLPTNALRKMLQVLGPGLSSLYIEVNPYLNSEKQVRYAVELLDCVAKFNHGLVFFCIENEMLHELPRNSALAKRLEDSVQNVVNTLPLLNSTNLRSLLSLWIGDEIEIYEDARATADKTEGLLGVTSI